MRVYIGYDKNEDEAYEVCCKSLSIHSDIKPEPLEIERLMASGLMTRPVDQRGQKYDIVSGAPCSTDFAASRFLVPIICQSGWALFLDCDMVFMADPMELMEYADPSKAVMVVKHQHEGLEKDKMCGMKQTSYNRKNWSSVVLFNCDHPANRRLSIRDINERPGRDLHGFYWLHDDEIGELPCEWNWLVDVQEQPEEVKIAHLTLGGPWFEDWQGGSFDNIWEEIRAC